jgi:hypothetical protein
MISGYFAYSLKSDVSSKIIRRTKKIIKITLITILLYIVYTFCVNIKADSVNEWLLQFLNWKQWAKIIVISDFSIINGGPLWYLPSLVYAYIFLYFIDKMSLYKLAYKIIFPLFLIRVVVSAVVLLLGLSWHLLYNFLLDAIPWLLMGNYIAYRKEFRERFTNKQLIVSSLLGVLFAVFFVAFDLPLNLSEVGIILLATSLFLLAVNNPSISINKKVEILGEKYSLYVYLIHILVAGVISKFIKLIGKEEALWYQWTNPIAVALVSIIGSIIIYHMINAIKKSCSK